MRAYEDLRGQGDPVIPPPIPVILRASSRECFRRISTAGGAGPLPEILQGRSFEGEFRMTHTP
jgi:hypothetical protein